MQTKNCSVVILDESIEFKDVEVNRLFFSIIRELMFKISDTKAVRLKDLLLVDFGPQPLTIMPSVTLSRMSEPVNLAEYRE